MSKKKSTLDHVMIDIETAGTDGTSAMFSIAAVPWDPNTGRYATKNYFYEVIDLQSCLDLGLTVSGETIAWWLQQSSKARLTALGYDENMARVKPSHALPHVLYKLKQFLDDHREAVGKSLKVWGNSAGFDLGILKNAYRVCDIDAPWVFWKELDVRTLVALRPGIKSKTRFTGTRHNPVDDCKHQIKYCSKIWKLVYGTTDKKAQEQPTKTPSRKKVNS